jgi:protease-4
MIEKQSLSSWQRARMIALWLVVPLLLGILLSLLVPRPVVGVIYLRDEIYPDSANSIIAQIAQARLRPNVRAVVLVVNSPGGSVVDTEAVYRELERLRQNKPVITAVESLAASGAYYLAAGTDYIYANASSTVGSIGVIDLLPPRPTIFEDVVTTGPYKGWGAPSDTVLRQMEMAKQGFYQAVKLGRGHALHADPEVLLRGQVWPGNVALSMGLVDELGTRSQAIERAASMAHIAHYQVRDLQELAGLPSVPRSPFFARLSNGRASADSRDSGLYLLYIPPSEGRLP